MTAGEIRRKTLSELRRARNSMMSAEWLAGVANLPEAERADAAVALLDVCLSIRRLENAGITGIRQELAGNEKALEQGVGRLRRAGEKLHRTRSYLKAAKALVATVAKVV